MTWKQWFKTGSISEKQRKLESGGFRNKAEEWKTKLDDVSADLSLHSLVNTLVDVIDYRVDVNHVVPLICLFKGSKDIRKQLDQSEWQSGTSTLLSHCLYASDIPHCERIINEFRMDPSKIKRFKYLFKKRTGCKLDMFFGNSKRVNKDTGKVLDTDFEYYQMTVII